MTKAEKFRALAVRLVLKFTDGNYTIKNVDTEAYNASTGVKGVTYASLADVPMAKSLITEDREIDGVSSDKHFSIMAAGTDISGYEPTPGDLVVTPNGDTHKVFKVKTDLYGAAYEMFVHKEQWQ